MADAPLDVLNEIKDRLGDLPARLADELERQRSRIVEEGPAGASPERQRDEQGRFRPGGGQQRQGAFSKAIGVDQELLDAGKQLGHSIGGPFSKLASRFQQIENIFNSVARFQEAWSNFRKQPKVVEPKVPQPKVIEQEPYFPSIAKRPELQPIRIKENDLSKELGPIAGQKRYRLLDEPTLPLDKKNIIGHKARKLKTDETSVRSKIARQRLKGTRAPAPDIEKIVKSIFESQKKENPPVLQLSPSTTVVPENQPALPVVKVAEHREEPSEAALAMTPKKIPREILPGYREVQEERPQMPPTPLAPSEAHQSDLAKNVVESSLGQEGKPVLGSESGDLGAKIDKLTSALEKMTGKLDNLESESEVSDSIDSALSSFRGVSRLASNSLSGNGVGSDIARTFGHVLVEAGKLVVAAAS